jgi:lysozyme family protein
MTAANFDRSLKAVLAHEGGFTRSRHDRGNWTSGVIGQGELKGTKYGIAAHAFPHLDIKNLTIDEAGAIYRKKYWAICRCDELGAGLDFAVFDLAVNSGVGRAVQFLQRVIGERDDGAFGPRTMAAVKRHNTATVIVSLCNYRLDWLKKISTWNRYGRGWERRVTGTKSLAIQMAQNAPPDDSKSTSPKPASGGFFIALLQWFQRLFRRT